MGIKIHTANDGWGQQGILGTDSMEKLMASVITMVTAKQTLLRLDMIMSEKGADLTRRSIQQTLLSLQ